MVAQVESSNQPEIIYPERDGNPMVDNTVQLAEPELIIYYPDGQPFSSFTEEKRRVENERKRANYERERAEKLAAKLRELGINPEDI